MSQSVRKKMKDKAFARGVHREDIIQGAQELGVDLDAHIAFCIAAMRSHAVALGLDGVAASIPSLVTLCILSSECGSNSTLIDFARLNSQRRIRP